MLPIVTLKDHCYTGQLKKEGGQAGEPALIGQTFRYRLQFLPLLFVLTSHVVLKTKLYAVINCVLGFVLSSHLMGENHSLILI